MYTLTLYFWNKNTTDTVHPTQLLSDCTYESTRRVSETWKCSNCWSPNNVWGEIKRKFPSETLVAQKTALTAMLPLAQTVSLSCHIPECSRFVHAAESLHVWVQQSERIQTEAWVHETARQTLWPLHRKHSGRHCRQHPLREGTVISFMLKPAEFPL